jgi:hypothetical protein
MSIQLDLWRDHGARVAQWRRQPGRRYCDGRLPNRASHSQGVAGRVACSFCSNAAATQRRSRQEGRADWSVRGWARVVGAERARSPASHSVPLFT